VQYRAAIRARANIERATEQDDPLANPDQAKAAIIGARGGVIGSVGGSSVGGSVIGSNEAAPIIGDRQDRRDGAEMQMHGDVLGGGVLADIGQPLLHGAV